MSPESLIYNKISKESDIWSYGVLLWEIFTFGCTPYPSLGNDELLERLKSGYRMPRPAPMCDPVVYDECMLACWHDDPKQRPSFSQLSRLLDSHRQKPRSASLEDDVEFIDQAAMNILDDDEEGEEEEEVAVGKRDSHLSVEGVGMRRSSRGVGVSGGGSSSHSSSSNGGGGAPRLTIPSESSFNKSSLSTNATNYTTTTGSHRSGPSTSTSASSLVFDDKHDRDSIEIK